MDALTLSSMAQLLGPIASTLMQQDEPIKNPHIFRKQFRLGGAVMDPREAELPMHQVEVEDQEVIQPPTGSAVEVRGNTHEEGGIPMDLETGTVVYSSTLKGPDGRTMAERKKSRDQLLEKLAKQLKTSKADSIHRATIERAMETTLLEDMADVTVMHQAFLKEQGGKTVKAQTGMVVGGIDPNDYLFDNTQLSDIDLINADFDGFVGQLNPRTLTADKLNPSLIEQPSEPFEQYTPMPTGEETQQPPSTDLTAGDVVSILGPVGKTLTTIFNRLGDRPTPNYMQNVGAQQEALQMQGMRGTAEARDLEMQRNNRLLNTLRFKNQARGASTQRAMDLGALTAAGETQSRISSRFQQLLNQQLQQMGQTATQNERMRAEGRKFADITDTQNRDNFATQLGTNIGDIGRGVQHMERNRNRRNLAERFQGADTESVLMSLLQGINL